MKKTFVTTALTVLAVTVINILFEVRYWKLIRPDYKRIEICFERQGIGLNLDSWCPYISNENGLTVSYYPR